MKEKYFPLEILKTIRQQNPEDPFDHMRSNWHLPDVTDDEIEDFLLDESFMTTGYKGRFQHIHRKMMKAFVQLMIQDGVPDLGPEMARTQMQDTLLIPHYIANWGSCKHVYQVDPVFFEALEKSSELTIPETFGKYVPFQDFYINLDQVETVKPICGAFVHIYKGQLVIYMVTTNQAIFSFYSSFKYQDGVYDMETLLPGTPFIAYDYRDGQEPARKAVLKNDCRSVVVQSIIQIVMFLSSRKPDISPSELTKRTYRKPTVVKDRFSEVLIDEVGVRYGKAIRLAKSQVKTQQSQGEEGALQPAASSDKMRKPTRPHVRAAHWQRYRVGEGKKEVRLHWIPPIFVCGGRDIPVTVQELKN